MSFANEQVVAEIVRQRLGEDSDINAARYLWVIPQALDAFARKVAQSPQKRFLLMTNGLTGALTSGNLNLSALIASNGIYVEYLKYGTVTHADSAYPLQFMENPSNTALNNALGNSYLFYYLKGTTLYTRNFTNTVANLSGNLIFNVPFRPLNVTQIPGELEDDFITKMIELITFGSNAEDGEK